MHTTTIYLVNTNYKYVSEYDIDEMRAALHDINANGYNAVDIKFDMNGDIIIVVAEMYENGEPYEEH